jgi:hypothetical protein
MVTWCPRSAALTPLTLLRIYVILIIVSNKGGEAGPAPAGRVERRLAELEERVERLEEASSPPWPAPPDGSAGPDGPVVSAGLMNLDVAHESSGTSGARDDTAVRTGIAAQADTAAQTGIAAQADGTRGRPGRRQPGAGDDVFWALHGLQDRVGRPGAVLFTGTVALPGGAYYEWQEGRLAGELLDGDWSESSPGLTALAHPVRLLLLREVLHGTQTAAQLSAHPRLGTSGQLYHHLRLLVSAGWLRSSARGQYDVPADRVVPLLTILAAAR